MVATCSGRSLNSGAIKIRSSESFSTSVVKEAVFFSIDTFWMSSPLRENKNAVSGVSVLGAFSKLTGKVILRGELLEVAMFNGIYGVYKKEMLFAYRVLRYKKTILFKGW